MKRVFSVIFALLLVVVMVSCNNVAVDDSDETGSIVINLGNSGRSVSGHFSSGDGTVTVLTQDDVTEWEVTLSTENGNPSYNRKVSAASSIRFNDVPVGFYHVMLKAYAGDVLIGEAQTENDSEKILVRTSVTTEVTLKFHYLKYIFHTSTDEDTDNPFKYRIPLNPGNIMALDASDTIPVPNYMINSRTPSGKAFDYWALVGDTSGTEYHSGDAISLDGKTLPLEFVAQWKDINRGTVPSGNLGLSMVNVPGKRVDYRPNDISGVFYGVFKDVINGDPGTYVLVDSFMIADTELTYAKWYEVYQWALTHGYSFAHAGRQGSEGIDGNDGGNPTDTSQPVTSISWRDAVVWCNAASEYEGLLPVYWYNDQVLREAETDAVLDGTGKAESVVIDHGAAGYRLPTVTEWEFAARGATPSDVSNSEWNYRYSGSYTTASLVAVCGTTQTATVKSKDPNGLQLYDMSGNVAEWCFDEVSGPDDRACCGGSYNSMDTACYVFSVGSDFPTSVDTSYGFRVVRTTN